MEGGVCRVLGKLSDVDVIQCRKQFSFKHLSGNVWI